MAEAPERAAAPDRAEPAPGPPRTLAQALLRVPRDAFIPARAWARDPSDCPAGRWIDREADPETWWRAVSSDAVIYTQLDDGRTPLTPENAARTTAPTCSASAPSLVTAFLRRLAPRPGDRVLEIGTGTGWTAGLLSYLTGDAGARVTSVEVDAGLLATARANLRQVGLSPHLVLGDGTAGAPPVAPFDRVHVTCGVREIPYAWVAQTRPGGTLVLPYTPTARLLCLTAHEDGTATGRFHEECVFMTLRGQRDADAPAPAPAPASASASAPADAGGPALAPDPAPRVRALDTDPTPLLDPDPGLRAFLDLLVGDAPGALRSGRVVLGSGDAHAALDGTRVTQSGPRNLWDEAEAAHRAWLAQGRPGLDRMGVTVTAHAQYVWLDDPATPVRSTLSR